MSVNIKFTAAVIAVVVIGFTASSYFFSTQPISIDLYDKSKYIQQIDACLESQTLGEISLNSFAKNFLTNLKAQAEAAESEEEIKKILDRLYEITSCEP
jgi:hypothetical protein